MIRRILLLILMPVLAISAISCDDLEDNTPALQVMVNGELFKAEEMKVITEEEGGYTLSGVNESQSLNIHLTNATEGSYTFGEGSGNTLSLITEEGEFTTTNENGGGEVMITDVGALDYITGTFHFLATDTSGTKMRGSNGHIYQVSFGSEDMELPDGELENEAAFVVDGVEVSVTDIEAQLVNGTIEVVVIGENDQRLNFIVNPSVEAGELTLPDENIFFAYLIEGENHLVESGTFEVTMHEAEVFQQLMAEFEGTTVEGHEISGSFQVSY